MLRLLARGLGQEILSTDITVERRALDEDVEVPGMGVFHKGCQGAFRFEVRGLSEGGAVFVLEHITRIDNNCAPDWPYPPQGQGCHQVVISGSPTLNVSIHAEDPVEPGLAGGGNASAAAWLVNHIESVCHAPPGVCSILELEEATGAGQLQGKNS